MSRIDGLVAERADRRAKVDLIIIIIGTLRLRTALVNHGYQK